MLCLLSVWHWQPSLSPKANHPFQACPACSLAHKSSTTCTPRLIAQPGMYKVLTGCCIFSKAAHQRHVGRVERCSRLVNSSKIAKSSRYAETKRSRREKSGTQKTKRHGRIGCEERHKSVPQDAAGHESVRDKMYMSNATDKLAKLFIDVFKPICNL